MFLSCISNPRFSVKKDREISHSQDQHADEPGNSRLRTMIAVMDSGPEFRLAGVSPR